MVNKQPGSAPPAWGNSRAPTSTSGIQPITTGITPTPSMYQGMAAWQTPTDMIRPGGMGRDSSGQVEPSRGQFQHSSGGPGRMGFPGGFGSQFQPMMDTVRQGAGPWGQAFMAAHQPPVQPPVAAPPAPAAATPAPVAPPAPPRHMQAVPGQTRPQLMGQALMQGRRY